MREWTLMRASEAPTGDGLVYVANATDGVDGELSRRNGMSLCTNKGAKAIAGYFFGSTGYGALLYTSTGTIETVSL